MVASINANSIMQIERLSRIRNGVSFFDYSNYSKHKVIPAVVKLNLPLPSEHKRPCTEQKKLEHNSRNTA